MSKYQFIITAGPENPVRATRAMMFASRAVEEGHEVSIFLVDDAVYLSNTAMAEKVQAPTGDAFKTYLDVILKNKTRVMVCLPCAQIRSVQAGKLPENWRIEKGVEAIRMDEAGYKTWVF